MSRRRIATILFNLAVIGSAWSPSGTGPALARQQEGAEDPQRMTGTVAEVDVEARRVRVVTGVGHATRAMAFHAGTGCRITCAGTDLALEDVTRGAIAIVHYHKTPGGYEAVGMEVRFPQPEGGEP